MLALTGEHCSAGVASSQRIVVIILISAGGPESGYGAEAGVY
jgi:hypothetical protein